MRISTWLCGVLVALATTAGLSAAVPQARAQEAALPAYTVKPLMIIRFNHESVQYGRQLVSAVTRVQEAKPDAVYTLVTFAPSYGDATTQAQLAERAEMQLQQVRAQLIGLQVPSERIEVVRQRSTSITHAEVHILVR